MIMRHNLQDMMQDDCLGGVGGSYIAPVVPVTRTHLTAKEVIEGKYSNPSAIQVEDFLRGYEIRDDSLGKNILLSMGERENTIYVIKRVSNWSSKDNALMNDLRGAGGDIIAATISQIPGSKISYKFIDLI
jgi:hypothetical protein